MNGADLAGRSALVTGGGFGPGYVEGFLPLVPLGPTGEPLDVSRAVAFLAGPAASWVTGQSVAVDGGNELRGAPH